MHFHAVLLLAAAFIAPILVTSLAVHPRLHFEYARGLAIRANNGTSGNGTSTNGTMSGNSTSSSNSTTNSTNPNYDDFVQTDTNPLHFKSASDPGEHAALLELFHYGQIDCLHGFDNRTDFSPSYDQTNPYVAGWQTKWYEKNNCGPFDGDTDPMWNALYDKGFNDLKDGFDRRWDGYKYSKKNAYVVGWQAAYDSEHGS